MGEIGAKVFIEKFSHDPSYKRPLKILRYLVQLLAIRTALSVAFYLLHTAVANGAVNKYGNFSQWRSD
jgi:hypothetical protein